MRILHWYPNFLGGGGVSNAVRGLMAAQARLGNEPLIAAAELPGRPLYESVEEDAPFRVVKWRPSWTVRNERLLLRGIPPEARSLLRKLEPDIVHVHAEFNPDNLWAARLFGCPLVLSPHGAFHPAVLMKSGRRRKSLYVGVVGRLLYNRIARFHAVSPMEVGNICSVVPAARVYVAPNLPHTYAEDASAKRSNAAGGNGAPVRLLFVGRLDVFTKGLDVLLDAYAKVAEELTHTPTWLTLVGPDWKNGRASLEQRAASLGLDRISFTGGVPKHEVARLLNDSDLYVHVSRHEGFSLSAAEALVAGKPAILSSEMGNASYREISSLPHVAVVPPNVALVASAIVDFVQRMAELRQAAKEAQVAVASFLSWERIARLHIANYAEISSVSPAERRVTMPREGRRTPG
jgi:glycosyltransferase involved in cell wall biosynthesis